MPKQELQECEIEDNKMKWIQKTQTGKIVLAQLAQIRKYKLESNLIDFK